VIQGLVTTCFLKLHFTLSLSLYPCVLMAMGSTLTGYGVLANFLGAHPVMALHPIQSNTKKLFKRYDIVLMWHLFMVSDASWCPSNSAIMHCKLTDGLTKPLLGQWTGRITGLILNLLTGMTGLLSWPSPARKRVIAVMLLAPTPMAHLAQTEPSYLTFSCFAPCLLRMKPQCSGLVVRASDLWWQVRNAL